MDPWERKNAQDARTIECQLRIGTFSIKGALLLKFKQYTRPLHNWDAHSRSSSHTEIKPKFKNIYELKRKQKPRRLEVGFFDYAATHVG